MLIALARQKGWGRLGPTDLLTAKRLGMSRPHRFHPERVRQAFSGKTSPRRPVLRRPGVWSGP